MLNVVVLVSGGGTNLQAIIDAIESGTITNTKITGVISNNKKAYALERARNHGIENLCISPKDYETRAVFNEKFMEAVDGMNPDLIVLAGFPPVPERPGSTFIGEPGVYEKCRISQGDAQSGAADLLNIHSNDLL